MIPLVSMMLALATGPAAAIVAQASPAPSAAPSTATPAPVGITTPSSTQGLVLPPVPNIQPAIREPAHPQLPSANIAGANGPFVGLALDDAIAMALARNTDLAVAQ